MCLSVVRRLSNILRRGTPNRLLWCTRELRLERLAGILRRDGLSSLLRLERHSAGLTLVCEDLETTRAVPYGQWDTAVAA